VADFEHQNHLHIMGVYFAHGNCNMDRVAIRPIVESDAEAYRALRLNALRQHPSAFSADYEQSAAKPVASWMETVQLAASGQRSIIYLAVAADQSLVGMTGLYIEQSAKVQHSGHIWGVYVCPTWRGQGIATRLVAACIDWAKTQAVRIIKLQVEVANAAAVRCYARLGFAVYGIEPEVICYDGIYYDTLLMARRV
jgi:RimJ/RimL family protein N-acetyltransferase